MEAMEKPRPDAKLKTLPEERQEEITAFGVKHTLAETVEWLGTSGMKVSNCALSRFLAWRRLKEQMERNEEVVAELLGKVKEKRPELTEEQVSELGQIFFCGLALAQQDAKGWYMAQRTTIRRALLGLSLQKYRDACALAKAEVAKLKDLNHKPTQEECLAVVEQLDRILGWK